MNKEIAYSVVVDIVRKKEAERKHPTHALFIQDILPELEGYDVDEIKEALNGLVAEERLKFAHSVNDTVFEL